MNPHRSTGAWCAIAWIVFAFATAGQAQTAAATATPPAPNNDAVVLNPFEVRTDKDNGYIANDTAVGGRLSMNLLEMPSDTTILTREFLDDIAGTSMTDAYNWMVTVPLEPGNPDWVIPKTKGRSSRGNRSIS